MEVFRLDDRVLLTEVVRELLLKQCYEADGIDVALSNYAPVDLDLLHECIATVLHSTSGAACDAR